MQDARSMSLNFRIINFTLKNSKQDFSSDFSDKKFSYRQVRPNYAERQQEDFLFGLHSVST